LFTATPALPMSTAASSRGCAMSGCGRPTAAPGFGLAGGRTATLWTPPQPPGPPAGGLGLPAPGALPLLVSVGRRADHLPENLGCPRNAHDLGGLPGFSGGELLDSCATRPGRRVAWTARVSAGVPTQGLDLVEAGRSVADVARDLEISHQSIYTWRRQDRIDRGLEPGLTSGEKAELATAKRRIAELETEQGAMRRVMELVGAGGAPKKVQAVRSWPPNTSRSSWAAGSWTPSVSGADDWRSRPPSGRAIRHAWPGRLHRRGPPARSWHRRRPSSGARRAALWPWDRGRPWRGGDAAAPRRACQGYRPAQVAPRQPDQIAADLVDRQCSRSRPNQLWVIDITEHATREGKIDRRDHPLRPGIGVCLLGVDQAKNSGLRASMGSVGDVTTTR
jgi:hypothetical protein